LSVAAAGGDSTIVRARRTALSYYQEFRVVGVFWCTVEVRRASARAAIRLGAEGSGAARAPIRRRWRTVNDNRGGACVGSTAVRTRGTALSHYGEFRIVGVFWCTVEVRLASARAGVRLGVSTGAALWRTGSDSRLAGGGSRTAVRARGSGLRSCSFVGLVPTDEGSAAGPILTGRHLRHGDGAIGHAGVRGDVVAGCGLACSLRGRRRRGGGGDSPAASRGVTKRCRACRYDCVCAVYVPCGAVIACGDAFAIRPCVTGGRGSGGSSRGAVRTS
jgi:hypothetical protein